MTAKTSHEDKLWKLGVYLDKKTGGSIAPCGMNKGMHAFMVTLEFEERKLTIPFFTGTGIGRNFGAASVLYSMISDAAGYDQARDFEGWTREYGFDISEPDGLFDAEATYRKVEKHTAKLRVFLGDHYSKVAEILSDY